MAPAQSTLDRPRIAVGAVEVVVAPIGIRLQDALPSGEIPVRIGHPTVAGKGEQRRRRVSAGKGTIVTDIGPGCLTSAPMGQI